MYIKNSSIKANNIFCIGRNYAEHAKELNNPIPTTEPIIFLKPNSALSFNHENLVIPKSSKHVDHEVEIVVVIGRAGKNISVNDARSYISHLAVGIDFTARDLQEEAKKKGQPWSVAKGFDTFAALGNLVEINDQIDLKNISLELSVNEEIRQVGNSKEMLFSIETIIHLLSHKFTLAPGDLIYTGTPKGVGAIKVGDQMRALINSGSSIEMGVVNEKID